MKNFVQPGRVITATAPYDVTGGDGVLLNSLFGIAAYSAAEGQEVEIAAEGVFAVSKAPADAFAIGDVAYWSTASRRVTRTATGNRRIGIATEPAEASAPTVAVRLNPVAVPD